MTNKSIIVKSLAIGIIGTSLIPTFAKGQSDVKKENSQPNVVIIYIDDMGYGDLGTYGATQFTTPNLDILATQGMRFTNYYAPQAVSSASRAGLLTGCYPNRVGIFGALFPKSNTGLGEQELTIAEMLKEKEYATGIFGKWHLGHHKKFLPLQHGFDEYFGIPYSNDMWPVDYSGKPVSEKSTKPQKARYPVLPLIEGNEKVGEVLNLKDQDKLTTLYTEHAVKFINKHKNKPFFLYLPHSMPHVPLGVSDKFRGKSEQGMYGDVIMEIDWSVGQVIKALKDNNLDDNTLVIFTSDNGPWLNFGNHGGTTGGLREGKGTSWEGGQRVPCIMYWKNNIPKGTICSKLCSTIDILPTLAAITNSNLPKHKIDGVNILPLLKGDKDANPRKVFYYYYGRNNLEAIRMDNWKLVLPHPYRSYEGVLPGNDGFPGKYSNGNCELNLYDLRRDPGERYDVKELYPEIVEQIQKIVEEARADLGDELQKREGKNRRKCGKL